MAEQDTVSFSIRMPKALREQLDSAAAVEGISTAKQIIRYIEAGLKGGDEGDPTLAPLLRRIREAEAITGKKWQEDVTTYGAAKELVDRWMQSERPRLLNYQTIMAASDKLKASENKLKAALESLSECGAIARHDSAVPGKGGLFGKPTTMLGLMSLSATAKTLAGHGYRLLVDVEAEALTWDLRAPSGEPLSDDEKLASKALLAMVTPWTEQVRKDRDDLLHAWNDDMRAYKAGQDLVRATPLTPEF